MAVIAVHVLRVVKRGLVPALVLALFPLGAAGDDIYLKSGGKMSGRIVSRTSTSVVVDVGAGRITVPAAQVLRIEEKQSALQTYEERAGALGPGDVDAWVALGEWASAQGLGTQARDAYTRALSASPGDPRANAGVGNVELDGRWVSQDESYAAKGYVKYQGEWMTPVEHQAMLSQEAASAQQEQARRDADQRMRESQAREDEAAAQAKKAAAEAAQYDEGLPLWYGWGAGPNAWPTGPMITRPAAPIRTRPVARPVVR